MFTYQKTNRYFGQIANGLEEIGGKELAELGASDIKTVYRGLFFTADRDTLYRINYCSRLCTRITALLLRFDCHSTKYLYQTASKINWQELLNKNGSFLISSRTTHSNIKHSLYAAQCLKDAIVDQFQQQFGQRPSISKDKPDLWLDLHIENNKASISVDTSGESLHRRGYRKESVEAPMQESLAAAIIRYSEWDGKTSLIDPMCGSGTLLNEALMLYCRIPAGFNRKKFGFMALPDYKAQVWEKIKLDEDSKIRQIATGLIRGSDLSGQAIKAAAKNMASLPHGHQIELQTRSYQDLDQINNSTIICNPPYGIRLKNNEDMDLFIKEFGNFLKRRCTGSSAYIYLGRKELLKQVGLKPSWKKPLMTGGLDGVLTKYDLY